MPTKGVLRSATVKGSATPTNAPLYVDSDDSKLKMIPAGSGTSEVEIVDVATAQTLVSKTLTSPTITTPTIDGLTYAASDRQTFVKVFTVSGDGLHAATAANITAFTAPAACIIERVILDVTTQSSVGSTVDVGYTAVSATTTSDTLLDGIDTGAGASFNDSMNAALDAGANALAQKAASGKWITITEKTGNTAGMVGKLYIYYTLI